MHPNDGTSAEREISPTANSSEFATVPPSETSVARTDRHSPATAVGPSASSPATVGSSDLPVIPGYEILNELGAGAMGVVYRARHLHLNRIVALKLMREPRKAGSLLERFRSEAKAVARLQHPNIVQIFDYGETGGVPYFSLEYLPDGSLDALLAHRPQPVLDSVLFVEKIARAIGHAHRNKIIHRDLKPANILLARRQTEESTASDTADPHRASPGVWEPKVADFGLAKSLEEGQNLTQSEALLGTCAYMAPEQAWCRTSEIGPATDIHALGLVLYEMLTGRAPFRDSSLVQTLDRVRFEPVPPPGLIRKELPPELDAICLRCLRKNPGERYRSAEDLADDLKRFALGKSVETIADVPQGKTGAGSRRIVGAIVATFLLIVATFLFGRGWKSESPVPKSADATTDAGASAVSGGPPRTKGKTFALLAGVRSYSTRNGAIDLEYTEADVDSLSRLLFRKGYEREDIRLLTQWSQSDNPALAPSGSNLRAKLRELSKECIPEDTVLVAVTGMGGDLGSPPMYCYFPADARLDPPESMMPLSEFYDLFRECPARLKLLLVDTCQSVSNVRSRVGTLGEPPPGFAAIFACSSGESSYEHASIGHGVFSWSVLKALDGEADADGDGNITLDELFERTRRNVEGFLKSNVEGAVQTPYMVKTIPGSTTILRTSGR